MPPLLPDVDVLDPLDPLAAPELPVVAAVLDVADPAVVDELLPLELPEALLPWLPVACAPVPMEPTDDDPLAEQPETTRATARSDARSENLRVRPMSIELDPRTRCREYQNALGGYGVGGRPSRFGDAREHEVQLWVGLAITFGNGRSGVDTLRPALTYAFHF